MKLTVTEQKIYDELLSAKGSVVSRQKIRQILNCSTGEEHSNFIDVHIKNLRRKIVDKVFAVRGQGYGLYERDKTYDQKETV